MKKELRKEIRNQLKKMAEPSYAQFSTKLLPGVEGIVGVRLPLLRKLAKQFVKEGTYREYLEQWNKTEESALFEEVMLQGMLIGYAPFSLDERFVQLEAFVPKIDNWSVCDSVCATMKFAVESKEETYHFLQKYIKSDEEYSIRFAVVMYINYYIDAEYIDAVLRQLCEIRHPAYYVKMAVAWALSMCYVFDAGKTMQAMDASDLDDFTYNKTMQKIIESRQVDKAEKENLKKKKRG